MLILQGPDHPVQALTFSPDATTLYAVQGHHGIRAWNVADRTATRVEFGGKLLVRQFVFHPGGRWAFGATAHTTPAEPCNWRLIDLHTGTMRQFNCTAHARDGIAFFPDGSRFVSIDHPAHAGGYVTGRRFCGWVMEESGPRAEWHRGIRGGSILFVAALDDQFASAELFWAPGEGSVERTSRYRVVIRRASDGAPVKELPFPRGAIQQLLASPDGAFLVARFGTELCVWGAGDWSAPPLVIPGTTTDEEEYGANVLEPAAAAFHPSGRYLLLATDDPSVIAFDTSTWQPAHRWTWDAGDLRACAVSPDGTLAAAGSTRGTVVVWDLDL